MKLTEVFFAASHFIPPTRNEEDGGDGISLNNDNPGNVESESDSPPVIDLRRSNRKRNPPDWLATSEIGRCG